MELYLPRVLDKVHHEDKGRHCDLHQFDSPPLHHGQTEISDKCRIKYLIHQFCPEKPP